MWMMVLILADLLEYHVDVVTLAHGVYQSSPLDTIIEGTWTSWRRTLRGHESSHENLVFRRSPCQDGTHPGRNLGRNK
jgi:hypothetical protein